LVLLEKSNMRWRLMFLLFGLMSGLAFGSSESFDQHMEKARAYLRQGQYLLAMDAFEVAKQQAATQAQQTKVSGFLGVTHYHMHQFEDAEERLREAIQSPRGDTRDGARFTALLAELRVTRGQRNDAQRLFSEAKKLAGDDRTLQDSIELGAVPLLPLEHRLAKLEAIRSRLGDIMDPDDRARFLIGIGSQARNVGGPGLSLAYAVFSQARQPLGQQPRLIAEALGGLAQLYEDKRRFHESLRLNRQAIQSLESLEAHDLLLELEWRQGRLHRILKQVPEAISAYHRAVDHIEAIRQDIPVEYHEGRSSFRETLEPVYLGLADLLLEQASHQRDNEKAEVLRDARYTVELIKRSELEDFLGGRCAVQSVTGTLLEAVEPQTAVVYPIILPERVELLVSAGKEVQQFTQAVDGATIQSVTRQFAHQLRSNTADGKAAGKQLYQWLMAPLEPWLRQHRVQTLVVVPDGVLRLVPFGALHDGEHYLIEKYSVAISPGLTLMAPTGLHQRRLNALLAGMSEPGPVVDHLPSAFLLGMADASTRRAPRQPSTQRALPVSISSVPYESDARKLQEQRLVHDSAFMRGLKEDLSLPGVAQEIADLRSQIPSHVLLNEEFTVNNFKLQLVKENYSVVHIASHGVFGSSADTSFIMAYDAVINIDELDTLLRSEHFSKNPLALLSLSACQTAEGDDRAPLGFSGAALKAKVGSALGTLWPVSDEAAARLMPEFYKLLDRPEVSKAEALRQAQLLILNDAKLSRPFFWAPFILVGSWL
jgi:CHAT domain-containing protein